ncbi:MULTISPECIES: hypothetical protein [unclassified Paenibacillus]|uniref:hypothetical protein n=1 Tax=unclassified Paenibacillus TaxID=185978 RepID=UPI001AE2B6A8|nr:MULTISPECIES: hypothetical protein [unclassified Paenibacillus]MBP1155253.1 hypothetical protein [Paenibacillus sp. PvP091]MBP1169363.1 hypothetical protein [Paenibacillus sp. PvR098]MBP2440391.1 hypothetical protein [Paenibacillus sp. PvP052]
MRLWRLSGILLLLTVLLSGCMYPKELRKENQMASGEYVMIVQNAIDQYKEKNGVLPIKNSTESTPIYEKYPIDFKKLQGPFLGSIPVNAFENGGTASYVLIDVETKPTVKMMDIQSFQKTMELQKAVDEYKIKSGGKLPLGEVISPGFHTIDYKMLNRKAMETSSVYSLSMQLPFIIQDTGQVWIDYAVEIMRFIDKKQLQDGLDGVQDLRKLLVEESYYVPARSVAYQWKDGRPLPAALNL